MYSRHVRSIALSLMLSACLMDGETSPEEELDDEPEIAAQQLLPNVALTRLVMLRSDSETSSRLYPIILTAARASDRPVWSSAFRLLCNDCKRGYEAFGYAVEDALFSVQYMTEAALRAENQVDDALPFIDLPIEATDARPAIRAAFRVVDAKEEDDPRYIVRLEAAPEFLYSTTCENFLRVGKGNTTTIPVTKALLAHWKVPAKLPAIGCSSIGGKALPVPGAAPATTPALKFTPIESVLRTNQPGLDIAGEAYPYVVAQEANGSLRGYAIGCGSEARSALQSLGLEYTDLRSDPATPDELSRTGFGSQPTIRCKGAVNGDIYEITSSNDSTKKKRFRFGRDRDLIEFACKSSESYWSSQATKKLDVPHQALPYLSDFENGGGSTRVFTLGCRSKNLCAEIPAGITAQCPVVKPVDPPVVKPVDPPVVKPTPPPPPVPADPNPPRKDPGDGCVYIQYCDFPGSNAGAVCRAWPGCNLSSSLAECRSDLSRTCGTPRGPNYFCNVASSECKTL